SPRNSVNSVSVLRERDAFFLCHPRRPVNHRLLERWRRLIHAWMGLNSSCYWSSHGINPGVARPGLGVLQGASQGASPTRRRPRGEKWLSPLRGTDRIDRIPPGRPRKSPSSPSCVLTKLTEFPVGGQRRSRFMPYHAGSSC